MTVRQVAAILADVVRDGHGDAQFAVVDEDANYFGTLYEVEQFFNGDPGDHVALISTTDDLDAEDDEEEEEP